VGSDSPVSDKVRALKAPEMLASRVREQILAGELKDGDKLPAEAILIDRFGVSRPTVREAYRILESENLLTINRGARGGAVVHVPDSRLVSRYLLMVLQAENATIAEIYQARSAFEPALARLVAEQCKPEAIAALRACIEIVRTSVGDSDAFSRAVTDFHRTMVAASGNRPLLHLFDALYNIILQHQAAVVSRSHRDAAKSKVMKDAARGIRSYETLVTHIENGAAAEAETHWHSHMETAGRVWIEGYEQTTLLELERD
jgi:DNA-binding FadR family transcriptional regulator